MSKHAWILENIESYLAGGLEPAESERLELHVAECASCARALADARQLDQTMEDLFAEARPDPQLEDQIIHRLRVIPLRIIGFKPIYRRMAVAAAAVVLLGVLGALGSNIISAGKLRFPGESQVQARNELKQFGAAINSSSTRSEGRNYVFTPNPEGAAFYPPVDFDGQVRDPGEGITDANSMAKKLRESIINGITADHGRDNQTGEKAHLRSDLQADHFEGKRKQALKEEDGKGDNKPDRGPAGAWGKGEAKERSTQFGMQGPPVFKDEGKANEQKPLNKDSYFSTDEFGWKTPEELYKKAEEMHRELNRDGKDVPTVLYFRPLGAMADTSNPGGEARKIDPGTGLKLGDQSEGGQGKAEKGKEGDGKNLFTGLNPGQDKKSEEPQPAPAARKIIIRSGEIEFEVESFDGAVATVVKLIGDLKEGGFVATVNSDKLSNGKVKGSVVVRVPPGQLDSFVDNLRKELGKKGELKGQRIGSKDITKEYTDIESRLRAARAMEERLLQIIKTGKGEVKDLLNVEKELGNWRTKIEEYEGELRYYSNLVALSTLTINLYEKEIRAPFAILETERVQVGLEVEDVEKAQQETLAAVAAAKGRVTKSELKKHAAGQYNAIVHFEVAPEEAGQLRDRLKQIGTIARLDVDRLQQTEGGTGRAAEAKIKRNDTLFQVSIYNLANVEPRDTWMIKLAAEDAEAAYKEILAKVEKAGGRITTSNLSRQRSDQTQGIVQCEVKTGEADAFLLAVKALGEVLLLQKTEKPDSQNVTRAKQGFQMQIFAQAGIAPRETAVIQLATKDVPASYRSLQEAIRKAKGRIINANLNEQNKQNITGQLDFEVRRSEEANINTAMTALGDIISRTVTRAPESEMVIDSKVLLKLSLQNVSAIAPREMYTLGMEVKDVDQTMAAFKKNVENAKGRLVKPEMAREPSGRITAWLTFELPLAAAPGVIEQFKGAGALRAYKATQNPQVAESELALARISVTLSNTELIIPGDEGMWPQIRKGLTTSFTAISWSLTVVIIGVCFVLPWAIVLYAAWLVIQRFRRKQAAVAVMPPSTPAS